jgi:hypothetical protein
MPDGIVNDGPVAGGDKTPCGQVYHWAAPAGVTGMPSPVLCVMRLPPDKAVFNEDVQAAPAPLPETEKVALIQ